ncbi:MAG: transglutaminase-like domain-containing protein [Cyanobacteria bacterium J06635_15]
MDLSLPHQHLSQALQKPDDQVDLAAAALYIAQIADPQLRIETYLKALDDMAQVIQSRLPVERYPLKVIKIINQYLFEDLGFRGNDENYYDPRNSYLNQVIDRRLGIPITLSLVYLEVARRIDFPMVGVGMPGHFLIRPTVNEMAVFVDGFHQGEILFEDDCKARIKQIYGASAILRPEYIAAVSPRQFLGRMLTNLKLIFLNGEDIETALEMIELLLIVMPDNGQEKRDRGLLFFHQGRFLEAAADLKTYLQAFPEAQDAIQVNELLKRITPETES